MSTTGRLWATRNASSSSYFLLLLLPMYRHRRRRRRINQVREVKSKEICVQKLQRVSTSDNEKRNKTNDRKGFLFMKQLARVAKIANVCANVCIRKKRANRPSRREADVQRRRLLAAHPANHTSTPPEHMRAPRSSTTSALRAPGPGTPEGLLNRRDEKDRRGREGKRKERLEGGDRREVFRFSGNFK